MHRSKSGTGPHSRKPLTLSVCLKLLAEHLGLSQAAVSLVINRSPAAKSIPHRTQNVDPADGLAIELPAEPLSAVASALPPAKPL